MRRLATILLAGLFFLAPVGVGASAITFEGSNLGFEALITDLGGGGLGWSFDSGSTAAFSITASHGASNVPFSYPGDPSLFVGGQFSDNPFSGSFVMSDLSGSPFFSVFDDTFGGNISFDIADQTLAVNMGIGTLSEPLLASLSFVPPPGFIDAFYCSALFDFDRFDFGALEGNGFSAGTLESFTLTATPVAPVPEPGTMALLGSGLVGLAGWGRKRFRG